ncbi:MAG: cache domain-containing protein, partial [Simkania negevensis]|nr:cache domain-containing protein [Simkania negevensis]
MLRKKNFLHFSFYRTIRVDILTVFLSLFIFSFLLVLLFTYVKSSKSILEFSVGTIERASAVVLGRVAETIRDCEQMPEIAADFFPSLENLTFENQKLLAYLESVIKFDTNFTSFYVATVDGGFIAVNNLELTGQTHYISDRLKILPLPEDGFGKILYSLTFVDRTQQPARSVWYYKNDKFQTVGKEEIIGTLYDPRIRPWYIGAVKSEGLHWENITEHYVTGGEKGINVAKKILNEKKEVIGVVGANMALSFFSKFLLNQKIGQTGRVFVLDKSGEILLPLKEDRQISAKRLAQEKELTYLAYQQFLENQQAAFRIEKEGTEYLSYLTKIPVAQGLEWYVAIIVPLSDFFIDLLHTQTMIAVITLMILIVSAIFVSYFSKRISSPIVQLAEEVDEIRHLRFDREKRVISNIKEID